MMELPQLRNPTSASAALHPVVMADGWRVLVVVKEVSQILASGALRPVRRAHVRLADEPWPSSDSRPGSIRYPHDLAPRKPSTDIIVVGDAIAPGDKPVRELDVRVEVGPVACSLRVFGPRSWYDAGSRVAPTDPLPFTRAPLRWENAFGGIDDSNPDAVLEEARNPLGRGLSRDGQALIGKPLPQVEDPTCPIESHRTRPPPAGVGAIGPSFEPRRSAAGTHDESWVRHRMPLPPMDFDDRFHQVAPPGLRADTPLEGGERVRLLGLHRDGPISLSLPRRAFTVEAPSDGGVESKRMMLDTILIEPNDMKLELTWRTTFAWPRLSARRATLHVRQERA